MKTPEPSKEITPASARAPREEIDAAARSRTDAELASQDTTVRRTTYLSPEEARAAMLAGRRWRRASRWIGLLVFGLGAILLAWVFIQALNNFRQFSDPGYLQFRINQITGDPVSQQITAYVSVLGGEALRFLYLLLLGLLGSFMAGKGIQFFAASESVIDEAVVAFEE